MTHADLAKLLPRPAYVGVDYPLDQNNLSLMVMNSFVNPATDGLIDGPFVGGGYYVLPLRFSPFSALFQNKDVQISGAPLQPLPGGVLNPKPPADRDWETNHR